MDLSCLLAAAHYRDGAERGTRHGVREECEGHGTARHVALLQHRARGNHAERQSTQTKTELCLCVQFVETYSLD
eukprot:4117057-Pleurochrysis_carterae.AAC.1